MLCFVLVSFLGSAKAVGPDSLTHLHQFRRMLMGPDFSAARPRGGAYLYVFPVGGSGGLLG